MNIPSPSVMQLRGNKWCFRDVVLSTSVDSMLMRCPSCCCCPLLLLAIVFCPQHFGGRQVVPLGPSRSENCWACRDVSLFPGICLGIPCGQRHARLVSQQVLQRLQSPDCELKSYTAYLEWTLKRRSSQSYPLEVRRKDSSLHKDNLLM